MATSKKITAIPEIKKLSDLISKLSYVEPELKSPQNIAESYLNFIETAFSVHRSCQILTVLIVGFCIEKLEILYENSGDRDGVKEYRKELKEKYNLSKKQMSNYKDFYNLFAEDYDKCHYFALKKQFEGYTISKLAELVVVAKKYPKDMSKFNPRMTVKNIREKKNELYGDFSHGTVNVDKSSENHSLLALPEQTIYESLTNNIDEGTVEKCINDFKQQYPDKNFNLKITICECSCAEQ